jgi:glutathione peroxidase
MKRIKWNFTKFLIDRSGNPIKRYSPQTNPNAIEKDIQAAL